MNATVHPQPAVWVQFWRLTKPRVVSLIVFTAVIGMLLASPTLPGAGVLAGVRACSPAGSGSVKTNGDSVPEASCRGRSRWVCSAASNACASSRVRSTQ